LTKKLLPSAFGLLFCPAFFAQIDYTNLYEHYKDFEQCKIITLYLTGTNFCGTYSHVNSLLESANLPPIDAETKAAGFGGSIGQDRLIIGIDFVVFHSFSGKRTYTQNGGFQYIYTGFKLFAKKYADISLRTGCGLGYLNVYTNQNSTSTFPLPQQEKYSLYNIPFLKSGLFSYNLALSCNIRWGKKFSLGLTSGIDCMPGSAWDIVASSQFSNTTGLREMTAQGFVTVSAGVYFDN
jgi:hypothetical protein